MDATGANGIYGTVYKVAPADSLTTLYSFCSKTGCADGEYPAAPLIQTGNGNLYGTTTAGGASCNGDACGTVFKITTDGTLTTLYSFCSQTNCADGQTPSGALVAADGRLYGTTIGGGANGPYGTVFKITPSGTLTTLYSFCSEVACADGQYPSALVQASDGNFYGTTGLGGIGDSCPLGCGTVFKITPGGALTTLHQFCSQSGCTDGGYPIGTLVQGSDGALYGTTYEGGLNNHGTVFNITPSGTLKTVYSFDLTDGANAFVGIVQDTNGNFYGTTFRGGANNDGTVFRLSVGLGPFVETVPLASYGPKTLAILNLNYARIESSTGF